MKSHVLISLVAACAPFGVFAQAPAPAPKASIAVIGCVTPEQRDGSLGPKATGTTVTPETAPMEANNPALTGAFLLLEATPAGNAATPNQEQKPTSYALKGQEKELAKHRGHHVEITGALLPPIAVKLPSRSAAAAEGIRSIQVASIKMLAGSCPATKKMESKN